MVDRAPPHLAPKGLAFILGFARSGTTLLGQILAASSDIVMLEEREVLSSSAGGFVQSPDGLARLARLAPASVAQYRDAYWRNAAKAADAALDGKVLVDQTALNTPMLPVIGLLFPQATVLFAVRDPRDVVLSCFRRRFDPTPFTLEFASLESTARVYDLTMRLAEACRPHMASRMVDVRYERVVADFDAEIGGLCARLGIAWTDAFRDFQRTSEGRMLTTASATQVRRGLNSDSIGAWRHYRDQMAPVLPLLQPWVERFGYPPN
jgi:hypothetical protein